jgi:hypothetical protein
VGWLANGNSSPGWGGKKSVCAYFFRLIRGWIGFIALPTADAVGLLSVAAPQLEMDFENTPTLSA